VVDGQEVELKWKIEEKDKIIAALQRVIPPLQFDFDEKGDGPNADHETNIWFAYRDPNGAAVGEGVRLRIIEHRNCGRVYEYLYLLTKKGPNTDPVFKVTTEEEIYIRFGSPQEAVRTFLFCGFVETFRYEKLRRNFRGSHIAIAYDTLPFIGDWIEIEGDKAVIERVAKLLGLSMKKAVNQSYKKLFQQWQADHLTAGVSVMTFAEDERYRVKDASPKE